MCVCGGGGGGGTFLGEQLFACLIDRFLAASAVIQQYHKTNFHPIFDGTVPGVAAN